MAEVGLGREPEDGVRRTELAEGVAQMAYRVKIPRVGLSVPAPVSSMADTLHAIFWARMLCD